MKAYCHAYLHALPQWACIIVLLLPALSGRCCAAPIDVTVSKTADGFQLLRGGKPYQIKGAAGGASLEKLKAAGGNSTRTWGADKLGPQLDEAERLGITVTVGIWLGHTEHGFDYSSADSVAEQVEQVRKAVLQYRDHPALLMWALGNEMEGPGSNAAIWSAIENLAVLVKRLDPHHPVMTVIAELGGSKVRNLHRLCPDIDVVGINSYAGAPSIPKRYRDAGGTKPYVLTEFGPPGTWEVGKKAWGAILEPTSTEKAGAYRRSYEQAVAREPLCLGSYAFTWGNKQEGTATWFGMLLPDGTKLGPVDAMTELWTGKPPANRCPEIASLKLDGPDSSDPGATVKASLDATDPDGDRLTVKWVLQAEAGRYATGGAAETALQTFPAAIVESTVRGTTVRLPAEPGGYRLFAYVYDGKGGAATANVPLLVKGEVRIPNGAAATLPLVVYDEKGGLNPPFVPTGWMGTTKSIKLDEAWAANPHSGRTCLRCDYTAPNEWGGVVWQSPPDDWGDQPGGLNLTGAKRLVFWARGEKGGEVVSFQLGLLGREKRFFDTANAKLADVKLTAEWRKYSLDLTGKDLARIKTGFAWTVAGQGAPVTFYLDDVRYE